MGRSCLCQVVAIYFDWSALATWNKYPLTAFWKLFSGIPHLPGLGDVPGAGTWHLNFQVPGALCQVTWKVGKWGIPEKGYQYAVQKCLSQVASALQSKLWPKPDKGNFSSCILPCKIGGSQSLMKEWYLSKNPFLTFVYLSKCNTKLPRIFGNSKKNIMINILWFLR